MITYLVNNIDISSLVYSVPKLSKRINRSSGIMSNNIQLPIVNENNIFSPENENSVIYKYRDDYSKIPVQIKDGDIIIWEGVVGNISRDDKKANIECVESIISMLDVADFIYHTDDGYVGDLAYAGDEATPAEHQLALLRRYLSDDNIDVASFKAVAEHQRSSSIQCSCEIVKEDKKVLSDFLNDLMLDIGYLYTSSNKIRARWHEDFLGDLGIPLNDDLIIDVSSIEKDDSETPYYSFSMLWDDNGEVAYAEGSKGDSGVSTTTSSTSLEDNTQEWLIDQWKDKYIFIGESGNKNRLRISGNNKTQIFFTGCTKTGAQDYIIVQNDSIYEADYSDYPIKIGNGIGLIGALVIKKSQQNKLKIKANVLDYTNLDLLDVVTLRITDEGINTQPFEILQIDKEIDSKKATIVCYDKALYPVEPLDTGDVGTVDTLSGYRQEDGSAVLSWDAVTGALYYTIFYGTRDKTYTYQTTSHENVEISENMERWLGYYFWVAVVNQYGVRGDTSEPIYLSKVSQGDGYIDGTDGYLLENYPNWGMLEQYHFLMAYKKLYHFDIGYLIKSRLNILSRSEAGSNDDIPQIFSDSDAINTWGSLFRKLGYIDCAGISGSSPEFYDDGGVYKIKNALGKKLTLHFQSGTVTVNDDQIISGSEDWFLKNYEDEYLTYDHGDKHVFDISNVDFVVWFKTRLDEILGIYEHGLCSVVKNTSTGIGTFSENNITKGWITNQWQDYYVGIVNDAELLDINWYKIISNTSYQITFYYNGENLSGNKYIINKEPYIGFQGVMLGATPSAKDFGYLYEFGTPYGIFEATQIIFSNTESRYEIIHGQSWSKDQWTDKGCITIENLTDKLDMLDSDPVSLYLEANTEKILYFFGNTYNNSHSTYWFNGQEKRISSESGLSVINYAIFKDGDLYLFGKDIVGGNSVACVWKNEEIIFYEDGYLYSEIKYAMFDGDDLYMAGNLGYPGTPCYWINGVISSLGGTGGAYRIELSGSNIYVWGHRQYSGYDVACYWIDEVKTDIGAYVSKCLDGFLDGSDLYCFGYNPTTGYNRACYWLNDVPTYIETDDAHSQATKGLLNGSDIYCVGYKISSSYYRACYWLNGTRYWLGIDGHTSEATGIFIDGSDVYIYGYEDDGGTIKACYWKNGSRTFLSTEDSGQFRAYYGFISTDINIKNWDFTLYDKKFFSVTYYPMMSAFLEDIVEYIEDQSYNFYGNWTRVERGLIALDCDINDLTGYSDYLDALNKRYMHYIISKDFLMSLNEDNEVTRQYRILDWHTAVSNWDSLKIYGGIGYPRMAIVGYPYNQQAMIANIVSYLIKSRYSSLIEDIGTSCNLEHNQLLYDMLMAGNKDGLMTIGLPEEGYENYYSQNAYDRYGIVLRKFKGAYVFYNPSRQIKSLTYIFGEGVTNYSTGQYYQSGEEYDLIFQPRSAAVFFRSGGIGEDAYNFLGGYLPYSYVDNNTAWIVFTVSGASLIGENSVWIENGYVGKVSYIDGISIEVPNGENDKLFHAGGSGMSVTGYDPEMEEVFVETSNIAELISETIVEVVKVQGLTAGTDYLVEKGDWDVTSSGKGKWKTYIHFLSDQTGNSFNVYYYEQGVAYNDWPEEMTNIEHGVLYRKSGFALKTGDIDEDDCSAYLTEGTHYYVFPEIVRHKWDYRISPFGNVSGSTITNKTINLNMLYSVGGNENIRAMHWEGVDPDNVILINANGTHNNSVNGCKATYASKTVQKPKILIYGFSVAPRNSSNQPITPASRVYDGSRFENLIKKYEGIYYEVVHITGDYDGVIETGSSQGAWGSILGVIDAGDVASISAALSYYDVIIINDSFIEYTSGSISGDLINTSWLNYEDYYIIKNFKKQAATNNKNVFLIDRTMGAPSFVWYGGKVEVSKCLLNKGTDLLANGSIKYSDLTNVFGCLYYGEIKASDLSHTYSNVYTQDSEGDYVKYSDALTADYRIGKQIDITKHYQFDQEEESSHPIYCPNENGQDSILYIPRTNDSREEMTYPLKDKSNLYLKWQDITTLLDNEDEFFKYEEMGLSNIIFRREPLLVYHDAYYYNMTYRYYDQQAFGNQATRFYYNRSISGLRAKFSSCFFFKSGRNAASFITDKFLVLREHLVEDFKSVFDISNNIYWRGYSGHKISVSNLGFTPSYPEYCCYGWIAPELSSELSAFDRINLGGTWFPASYIAIANDIPPIEWGNTLVFEAEAPETSQQYYKISKLYSAKGCIPYSRAVTSSPPLEGKILSITKNYSDGTVDVKVDFDVSQIGAEANQASGTSISAITSYLNQGYWLCTVDFDISAYRTNQYFIHIEQIDGDTKIFQITNRTYWNESYLHAWPPGGPMKLHYLTDNEFIIFTGLININYIPNICSNATTVAVRGENIVHRVATVLTDNDRNVTFNSTVLSKNEATNTLKIYLNRGVNQPGAGGYLIAYRGEEDQVYFDDDTGDEVTKIANRDILGGRVTGDEETIGSDIVNFYHPEKEIDLTLPFTLLENTEIKRKPSNMLQYEFAYKNLIKEFVYEKNTGLISGQIFYAHGKTGLSPVIVWPYVNEGDIIYLINKLIGVKLTFSGLHLNSGEHLYLYYNSFSDMLKINADDVENPISGYNKFGDLSDEDDTLMEAIAKGRIE